MPDIIRFFWVIEPLLLDVPDSVKLPFPLIVAPVLFVNAFMDDVPLFVSVPLFVADVDTANLSKVKFPLFDKVFCVRELICAFAEVSTTVEPVPEMFVAFVLPCSFKSPEFTIFPSI